MGAKPDVLSVQKAGRTGVCPLMSHLDARGEQETMPGKRKINLADGSEVEGSVMTFRSSGEHWNEYLVDDGSVVRIKLVATEVLRIDGQYDPQGNPVYLVQSTNVMSVDSPENLRKEGSS